MRPLGGAFLGDGDFVAQGELDEVHAEDVAEGGLGGEEDGLEETAFVVGAED